MLTQEIVSFITVLVVAVCVRARLAYCMHRGCACGRAPMGTWGASFA